MTSSWEITLLARGSVMARQADTKIRRLLRKGHAAPRRFQRATEVREAGRRPESALDVPGPLGARNMRTVAIVYKWIPQYRRRFFELLRETLAHGNVELILVYGQPTGADARKGDAVDIPWGIRIPNHSLRLAGVDAIWQPCLRQVRFADLVIVEQANKLLVNYVLLVWRRATGRGIAFWGHGRNFQAGPGQHVSEWLKSHLVRSVTWWFAYGPTSAGIVAATGFDSSRITEVQNSVDTSSLAQAMDVVTVSGLAELRESLGLDGGNVCIYCGAMYHQKRLPFLIKACERIRDFVPDFEMLFLGAGPSDTLVHDAASRNSWMHVVGPVFEDARAPYFALSKLQLMPGLVGLGIIDSFVTGVPLVTSSVDYHSPEIEYLRSDVNGVMVDDKLGVEGYSQAVVGLLSDEARRAVLVAGCREAASQYTLEAMVANFAEGVIRALEV